MSRAMRYVREVFAVPNVKRVRLVKPLRVINISTLNSNEEIEPDDWDLEMLARIEARGEQEYIPFEECCRQLGVDIDEIRNNRIR